jgi:hypothetical protein
LVLRGRFVGPGALISNKKCTTWYGMPSHRHNLRWTVISRTTKADSNPRGLHSVAIYRATSLLRRPNRSLRRISFRLGNYYLMLRKAASDRRCPTTVVRVRQGSVMHRSFMDLPVSGTRTTWRSLSQDRRPMCHPSYHRFY